MTGRPPALPRPWTDPVLLADARAALLSLPAAGRRPAGRRSWLLVDAGTGLDEDAADALAPLGLVGTDATGLERARVRIEAVLPWSRGDTEAPALLVSDLLHRPPLASDHVLGAGGAADTLASITVPLDAGSTALDLGTGSGVQALHLASAGLRVTGTDVNPRALELARRSLALSGLDAELLEGDAFVPVGGRRFDLIVSNPPMVLSPSRELIYRDASGAPEAFCRAIVAESTRRLRDGGWCQLLAHWLVPADGAWAEHVAAWLPRGAHAWVVQRDLLDVDRYVQVWAEDSGLAGAQHADARRRWVEWLRDQGAAAVGLGWMTLRRTDGDAVHRLEELTGPLDPHVGPWAKSQVLAWDAT